jgi:signal transduction histidine kinase
MSEPSESTHRIRRRRYVVGKLQWAITLRVLAVLVGVAILYFIGLFVLPGETSLAEQSADQVKVTLLRANLIYFTLGCVILAVVTLLLTHRVAGAAFSLKRSLRAMQAGDYSAPIRLRRRDYLKALGAEIDQLRCNLLEQQREHRQMLEELERCVQEESLTAAREVLVRLQETGKS